MNNNHQDELRQIIEEMLLKMDFNGRIEVGSSQSELITINIKSDEAGLLIGQGGDNLACFQHLARAVVNKKFGAESPIFVIDINDYRAHRLELLRAMALDWARQAVAEKQVKILDPMPSYERRVVHSALSDFPGVKTESQGEGAERQVVIKPL